NPQAGPEVEHSQLAGACGGGMDRAPSSWHKVQDRPQSHKRSADVDHGLYYIGPDYRRQSALERIDERQYSNNRNRCDFPRAQRDGNHNRDGIHADALRGRARQQKKAGSHRAQFASEASFNEFIRRVEIAAKVVWEQDKADYDAPDTIAHDHLQEGEIGIVGEPGNTDDGERAGFGGDNGKCDRPPRDIAPRQKIIAQRAMPLAKAE